MPGAIRTEMPQVRKPDDFQPAGFDPLDVPQGRFPGDIEDPGGIFQHVKITGVERAGVRHGRGYAK